MALEIGGGIIIGGGITVAPEAAVVSMVTGTFSLVYTPMGNRWYSNTFAGATLSLTPNTIVNGIEYAVTSDYTIFNLFAGTFGSYTIDSSGVNGNPTLSVTIDGITQTASVPVDLGGIIQWLFFGNPFSIDNGNLHTISIN
jgi:hypothetical protein